MQGRQEGEGGGGGAGGKVNHGVNRLLNKQQSRAFFKGTRSDKCELNSGFPNPGWLSARGFVNDKWLLELESGQKSPNGNKQWLRRTRISRRGGARRGVVR